MSANQEKRGFQYRVGARAPLAGAVIEISPIEVLALKKLVLINGALAKQLGDGVAGREQTALLAVLIEVVNRADLANQMPTKADRT